VVREQVDAAGRLARESSPELFHVLRHRRVRERARDLHQQPQVLLTRLLALAEPRREGVEQALLAGEAGHAVVGEVVCAAA
jgi:hypothetical protein